MAEYEPIITRLKKKNAKTAKAALSALMSLCSRGERSSGDARRLMREWEVPEAQVAEVLERLFADKYIDDRRYAEAFVRDKMAFGSWGLYKITQGLVQKGIAKDIIEDVISTITKDDMGERLESLLRKKMKTMRESDKYKLKTKLIRAGASAGYDLSSVIEVAGRLIQLDEDDEI